MRKGTGKTILIISLVLAAGNILLYFIGEKASGRATFFTVFLAVVFGFLAYAICDSIENRRPK